MLLLLIIIIIIGRFFDGGGGGGGEAQRLSPLFVFGGCCSFCSPSKGRRKSIMMADEVRTDG